MKAKLSENERADSGYPRPRYQVARSPVEGSPRGAVIIDLLIARVGQVLRARVDAEGVVDLVVGIDVSRA